MKTTFPILKSSLLLSSLILVFVSGFAQITPGLIIDQATGSGRIVLDPNLDGYTSATTAGFGSNNDSSTSEIPFSRISTISPEPSGDVSAGPTCGYTDYVETRSGNNITAAPAYYYLDSKNNWIFRLRLGNYSPNSKSYSVLIDIDSKFGNTGKNADPDYVVGNPGFEIELLISTGGSGQGVYIYNINNNTLTATELKKYAGHVNYQKSKATSYVCSTYDYFLDFFILFSDISDFGLTTSTPLRWAITDNMSSFQSTIGHLSNISDLLGGASNGESGLITIINKFPPTCVLCTMGLPVADCPSITSPIYGGATSVSGTSSYANGTTIKIYDNSNSSIIGTTTVSSGTWTVTVSALTAGQVIGASATPSGYTESVFNCNLVTIAASCTVSAALPNAADCGKGISGTGAISGAVIKVYYGFSSTELVPTAGTTWNAGGFITGPNSGTWYWKNNNDNGASNNCSAGSNSMTTGYYNLTQTASGQC